MKSDDAYEIAAMTMDTAMTMEPNVTVDPSIALGHGALARTVVGIILSLLIAVTVAGNVLVMLSVARIRWMRTLSNAFVFSLAVADALVGLFVMPWSVLVQWNDGYWYYGQGFCQLWMSWDVYFSTSSIVHFSCLAIDRYLAISDPFRYVRVMNRKTVAVMIVLCWSVPGFISFLPILNGWNVKGIEHLSPHPDAPVCFLLVNRYFAVICSCIAFYIPLAAILFCYYRIFAIARQQATKIHALEVPPTPTPCSANGRDNVLNFSGNALTARASNNPRGVGSSGSSPESPRKSLSRIKRDTKAAKTLARIVGGFTACYLPFFTMNILDPFFDNSLDPTPGHQLWVAITWLGYCNSMINPWIYYVSNKNFRAAFRKILRCAVNRRPQYLADDDPEPSYCNQHQVHHSHHPIRNSNHLLGSQNAIRPQNIVITSRNGHASAMAVPEVPRGSTPC